MKHWTIPFSLLIFILGMAIGKGLVIFQEKKSNKSKLEKQADEDRFQCRNSAFNDYIDELRDEDEQIRKFVDQFSELDVPIETLHIVGEESDDGRFVLRLQKSGQIIASDLVYPTAKDLMERNRHYSYSNNGKEYTCDFAREIGKSDSVSVLYSVGQANGLSQYIYLDSDGDGLWDRFTDNTIKPPQTYKREQLEWKPLKR